ncbi:MAG: squalene/phytoene synthase family protein [Defluviicoccus sp.]|nr:squalene/phytoene synthase family protein [Defluviicoccus sp.]MDE0383511.1 squalene/phytoene synthase family protein [Defluviicoccus sp.]
MRPTTPLDTRRLEAWPEIVACAAALEDARALADDSTRPVDERRDALASLAGAAKDAAMKRAYQAQQKALVARRFRSWSELVSYAGFAVAPFAEELAAASGLDEAGRQKLGSYCVAAHLLDLALDCGEAFRSHDRIYLPGDWLRAAEVAPEDLAKRSARRGLQSVLVRLLDRVDPMMADGFAAAGAISDPALREVAMTEIAERSRLARRLRRRDPLAGPIGLTALDRWAVRFRVRFQRKRGG